MRQIIISASLAILSFFIVPAACAHSRGETARPPTPLDAGGFDGTRFAVIGDFGDDSKSEASVAALVRSWNPDFVITVGDNNYPIGASLTIDQNIGKHYQAYMGNYRGRYGKGSTKNHFWPTAGNHDWFGPEGLSPYLNYFTLPGNERYYDVDLGLIHLFALDSDSHEPDGVLKDSKQAAWLQEKMTASKACFKFVYFHHAPYSSSQHGNNQSMQWPFKAWGADAIFSGHDHTYERVNVDGLLYFVNGLGGLGAYVFKEPIPQSQFKYNNRNGAMLVWVNRQGVEFEFRDVENRLVDHVHLDKSCPAAP